MSRHCHRGTVSSRALARLRSRSLVLVDHRTRVTPASLVLMARRTPSPATHEEAGGEPGHGDAAPDIGEDVGLAPPDHVGGTLDQVVTDPDEPAH